MEKIYNLYIRLVLVLVLIIGVHKQQVKLTISIKCLKKTKYSKTTEPSKVCPYFNVSTFCITIKLCSQLIL